MSEDGYMAAASRCNDGFPAHGNFRRLLFEHATPRALLDAIETPGFAVHDHGPRRSSRSCGYALASGY